MSKQQNGKTVVLVYSGGLDTSICIPMMKEEYGYERVVTVTVDVGQSREDIEQEDHADGCKPQARAEQDAAIEGRDRVDQLEGDDRKTEDRQVE